MYFTLGACIGGPLRLSIKESDLPLQRVATRFLNARIACSVRSLSPIALADWLPQPWSGGGPGGWGFHLPGRLRNKALTLSTIPVTILSCELGCSGEAHA